MNASRLPCFSFCPYQALSVRTEVAGRPLCSAMRKRRPLKPTSRLEGKAAANTVSRLKDAPGTPAALAIAFTAIVTVVGLLTARAAQTPALRNPHAVKGGQLASLPRAPVYSTTVLAEYTHDYEAFTQGLTCHNGQLFESTGLRGRSSLRHVDVETGTVIKAHHLDSADFGEGLAIVGENGDKIVQLVWKTGKGYVYNREDLTPESEFSYEGDGWGIASWPGKSHEVFLSDGSSRIRVYRLVDGALVKLREFTVRDGLKDVGLLNELEIVGDELWANVWLSSFIARIDPQTGTVVSWLDLQNILDKSAIPKGHEVDVLNGIAYDNLKRRVYVTGKLWPRMYSIQVSDKRVADNIERAGNAFFLDPNRVKYVHESIIGM